MRGTTAAVICSALALVAAGCGGDQIAAEEVTGEPPTLTIPKDTKLTAASRAKDDADADATATPTATADASTTGGATTGTGAAAATPAAPAAGTTGGTTGGTTPTQPQTQAPADTGGASADQDFDEFCANNPGAC